MSKFWRNLVNAVVIILISGSVAAGVTAYVMKHNKSIVESSNGDESIFKQPVHLASLNSVAAENIDFTYAAEKTVNAVVHIRVTATVSRERRNLTPWEEFFGYGDRQQRPRQRQGSGSGVIISTDGYIMTANHVIEGADSISVMLNDKRTFTAKLVGGDSDTDIALIKIEADNLSPIPRGDSDELKVGEWVLAVGNPFELTSTVTAGIVSAKGRPNYNYGNYEREDSEKNRISSFIQTDAAVNPGNSGGALVNTRGELVGINTMIYSQTGNFAGYSFAVPISIAGRVVDDLKKYGVLQRAVLGVKMGDADIAKQMDSKIKVLEGAYVDSFSDNSAAKEAGIEKGDVIIAVNNIKITSGSSLQEQIMKYQVGEKVRVKVDRYGTEKEFTVELRNAQGNTEIVKGGPNSADILGAAFKALSDNEKKQYRIDYGIEVTNITRGKFRDQGIRNGFVIMIVNDQKIKTPEDFYGIVDKILKGNTEEKGLLIRGFYPSTGNTRHYAIDLVD